MYKNVRNDRDIKKYLVIDLDTKKVIRGVQWANDKTGKYEKLIFEDMKNNIVKYDIGTGKPITEIKKGNILIVKRNGMEVR